MMVETVLKPLTQTQKNNQALADWYYSMLIKEDPSASSARALTLNKSVIANYPDNIAKIYRKTGDLSSLNMSANTQIALTALLSANGDLKKAYELFEKAKKEGTKTKPLDPAVGDLA